MVTMNEGFHVIPKIAISGFISGKPFESLGVKILGGNMFDFDLQVVYRQ